MWYCKKVLLTCADQRSRMDAAMSLVDSDLEHEAVNSTISATLVRNMLGSYSGSPKVLSLSFQSVRWKFSRSAAQNMEKQRPKKLFKISSKFQNPNSQSDVQFHSNMKLHVQNHRNKRTRGKNTTLSSHQPSNIAIDYYYYYYYYQLYASAELHRTMITDELMRTSHQHANSGSSGQRGKAKTF
mgnify:CR=1 FL=1